VEIGICDGPGDVVLLKIDEALAPYVDEKAAQVVQEDGDLGESGDRIRQHMDVVLSLNRWAIVDEPLRGVVEQPDLIDTHIFE